MKIKLEKIGSFLNRDISSFIKKSESDIIEIPIKVKLVDESDVIVVGKDFNRRMDWKGFLSYAKGVGSVNNINVSCKVPYRHVFAPFY